MKKEHQGINWETLAAAFLEGQGIKGGKRTRMVAGILMRLESMNQPAPESESSVPTVAVGLLRAEKPKDVSLPKFKVERREYFQTWSC